MIEMAELGDLVLKRIKIVSKIEKITITTFSQHFLIILKIIYRNYNFNKEK